MGNDKTSWLNLDDDDDELSDVGGGFTESLPADGQVGPTHLPSGFGADATDGMRTFLEPGAEKTEIHMDEQVGFDPMVDPIVGWLVVVKGPGLGQAVNLGGGMNSIGRDPSEQVSLEFGDKLISSKDHLRVIYDDQSRSFLVAPGSGRNVSRINSQVIAQTMPLSNLSVIDLSKHTSVRFVCFCGEDFDWSDLSENDA
ncbi:FHA domain-containing protein [Leisingera sp. S232]|uniref:FHA domain-containing protein n=1 Tax=Leisingera sp. S232 TaxID=3415132 RepID=UPI003C79C13C